MKVKLNANNLRKKIKDIRDLADRAETARTQIDTAFERESDPVSLDDFLTQSNDGIQRVRTVADKVEKSMNTIISLNENGVGKMEGGEYTLDIPDDAHVTDMKTLDDWAGKEQAKVDADDLKGSRKAGQGAQTDHTMRSFTRSTKTKPIRNMQWHLSTRWARRTSLRCPCMSTPP